jgi:hypothetical protein
MENQSTKTPPTGPESSLEETPEKKDTTPSSGSCTTTKRRPKGRVDRYPTEGGIQIIGVDNYHKAWGKPSPFKKK